MAVTNSCCNFITASFLKRFRDDRFASETAVRRFRSETATWTWIRKWFKISDIKVFKVGAMGVVTGMCIKFPRESNSNGGD
jgi:hypothetical protein